MKTICLLGASGSIGLQTLEVIDQHPDRFTLESISVGLNVQAAKAILETYDSIRFCYTIDDPSIHGLNLLFPEVVFFSGEQGLLDLINASQANWVVSALTGFAGFKPTLRAIERQKNIALANKETLVAGGALIMEAVRVHGVQLTPIDSEHSAIYQALAHHQKKEVASITLTASGGAFRDLNHDQLQDKTKEDALKHPNWQMGAKITIDSATMMNKGFEVMEAHWLYGLDYQDIHVLIQPESLIHGFVEFVDGSIVAQLAGSDMRIPIAYALSDQEHVPLKSSTLDFSKALTLQLKPVEKGRYPLFDLALEVGPQGGILPIVLNAANEVAVEKFLLDEIDYYQLEAIVIQTVHSIDNREIKDAQDVIDVDHQARQLALEIAERISYGIY